jgi:uncharacterized protein YjgD (DUF1641 family)
VADDVALQALNEKIDALSVQVQALIDKAQQDEGRRREWEELRGDLAPIANDLYLAAVEQLSEVEPYVRLGDILFLLKRLARNTQHIEQALEQLESLSDLADDATPLGKDALVALVELLDRMERRGYMALARQAPYLLDRIAASFGPEDVRLLGDNVVTILTTVREMTQPEVMGLAQNVADRMRQAQRWPQPIPAGWWAIARQLANADVRRGLALTLEVLRAVGEEHPPAGGGSGRSDGGGIDSGKEERPDR